MCVFENSVWFVAWELIGNVDEPYCRLRSMWIWIVFCESAYSTVQTICVVFFCRATAMNMLSERTCCVTQHWTQRIETSKSYLLFAIPTVLGRHVRLSSSGIVYAVSVNVLTTVYNVLHAVHEHDTQPQCADSDCVRQSNHTTSALQNVGKLNSEIRCQIVESRAWWIFCSITMMISKTTPEIELSFY